MKENEVGTVIVDCAVQLHRATGPGLFENVYEYLLAGLLKEEGLKVERQVEVPIRFRHHVFPKAFRADLIVEDLVIVELKSVEFLSKAHSKQLLTYLKLSGRKLGYLLNFGAPTMKEGIHRIISGNLR